MVRRDMGSSPDSFGMMGKEMISPRRLWVGVQNDGLAIIDRPPSPTPYDGPIPGGRQTNVIAKMMENDRNANEVAGLMAAGPEFVDLIKLICRGHFYSLPIEIRKHIQYVARDHGIDIQIPRPRNVAEGGPPPTLADLSDSSYMQGIMARTKK